MRPTCACPETPTRCYMAFKPYGAQRVLTEPDTVLKEWLGSEAPVLWGSMLAAVNHQRSRSSDPAINHIDTFALVCFELYTPASWALGESLTEIRSPDPRAEFGQCFIVNEDALEILRPLMCDPTRADVWMRLITAEAAEVIHQRGYAGD